MAYCESFSLRYTHFMSSNRLQPQFTTLDQLSTDALAEVISLDDPQAFHGLDRTQHLTDIGFMPGEEVAVVARSWPAGDPLVVRIGSTRFALRKAEAACVCVKAMASDAVERNHHGAPA